MLINCILYLFTNNYLMLLQGGKGYKDDPLGNFFLYHFPNMLTF